MSDERELWALPDGEILAQVHARSACEGRGCPMHHPSDHPMKDWPLLWSDTRKQMYRVCEHGFQHPDPDDIAWRKSLGFYTALDEALWLRHLCCGDCPEDMREVLVD